MSSETIDRNNLARALNVDVDTTEVLIAEAGRIRMERDNLKALVNDAASWAKDSDIKIPAQLLGRLVFMSDHGRQLMGRIAARMTQGPQKHADGCDFWTTGDAGLCSCGLREI